MLTDKYTAIRRQKCFLPIFLTGVSAGFPSPAEDYIEKQLDLNDLVIQHPSATFFVRVVGDSMRDAGIFSGDILAVDRSLEPSSGKIVVALLNGEFTVKRLHIDAREVTLLPENEAFPAIVVTPDSDFQVWGVVTYVIHKT
jgi:DNA polymerase V